MDVVQSGTTGAFPPDEGATGYGMAIDIGTTTVVAHLHEMCHPSGGSRWTFADGDAAKGESEKAGVPAVVPFWGERIA